MAVGFLVDESTSSLTWPKPGGSYGSWMARQASESRLPMSPLLAGTDELIRIPGGMFRMGSDHHYPDEAPAHLVAVDGFWMDRYPVTNAKFTEFIEATGYTTLAERPPDPTAYPEADPELLVAGSAVFCQPAQRVDLRNHFNWFSDIRMGLGHSVGSFDAFVPSLLFG
jgi:formylglycine-generating enzyme required for sulfatase activity